MAVAEDDKVVAKLSLMGTLIVVVVVSDRVVDNVSDTLTGKVAVADELKLTDIISARETSTSLPTDDTKLAFKTSPKLKFVTLEILSVRVRERVSDGNTVKDGLTVTPNVVVILSVNGTVWVADAVSERVVVTVSVVVTEWVAPTDELNDVEILSANVNP